MPQSRNYIEVLVQSVKPWSRWLLAAAAYPRTVEQLGVFLLPHDGMLVHRRSLPRNLSGSQTMSRYSFILLGEERGAISPENTMPCPRPGLEPRLLVPGTSTLNAAKYEIQKPSTCHAILFRRKFWSMFLVFHLARSTCRATKKKHLLLLRKVERGSTLGTKFWVCCSFFIKLTTCRATNVLAL